MNMPANPVPGEPPEVQTLRTLLANAQEALLVPHVDRAIVGRRVAALRYALRVHDCAQKLDAEITAWLADQPPSPIGPLHGAGMATAYEGIRERLAALLRPAATEGE